MVAGGASLWGEEKEFRYGLVKFEIPVRHCGRQNNAPKDVRILNPGTCEYLTWLSGIKVTDGNKFTKQLTLKLED